MSLAGRLRRWSHDRQSKSFRIGGMEVGRARPVRTSRSGSAANKAGRLALIAETVDGARLKIYEAASEEHAGFIRETASRSFAAGGFPDVVGTSGRFVLAEWADGQPLSKPPSASLLERVAELQAQLHSAPRSGRPDSGFDYWHDFVAPRFVRASELGGEQALGRDAIAIVEDWQATGGPALNHPDLTLDNIVIGTSGRLIVVDNELLNCGRGSFMDVLNTLRSLGPGQRPAYLDAYLGQPGIPPFPPREVLRAFWLAREAGSCFIAGNAAGLAATFAAYRAGDGARGELPASLFGD